MVVLALQPKGYAASLFYTPFDRTSEKGEMITLTPSQYEHLVSRLPNLAPVQLET